jgi:FKBP-type peptidyl-prolyl cis-trans isomerase
MNYNKLLITIFLVSVIFFSCNETTKEKKNLDMYNEPLEKINRYLVKEDSERIANYVARKEWDMQITKSGLWFQIYEQGNGLNAVIDKIATINFSVELLDGTLCYSSDSLGQKRFKIGKGGVESGLEQGLLMMKEGDKARFILPPFLGHGLLGDEYKIPPRSTIVYDVELVKISDY